VVKTEIAFDTFKSHTIARITTFITWRMGALALVNKSEGMFVQKSYHGGWGPSLLSTKVKGCSCKSNIEALPNLIFGYFPRMQAG
jgi:hypothetical protein